MSKMFLVATGLFLCLFPLCTWSQLTDDTETRLKGIVEEYQQLQNTGDFSNKVFDLVIDEIVSSIDDETCGADMDTLKGLVQNLKIVGELAMPMSRLAIAIDAFGKPQSGIFRGNTKNMGNFDECLSVDTKGLNFSMQYCWLPISITVTMGQVPVPFAFNEGVCLPTSCSLKGLDGILPLINTILSANAHVSMGNLTVCSSPDGVRYNAGSVIMILISLLFVALVFAATLFELLLPFLPFNRTNGVINGESFEGGKESDSLLLTVRKPNRFRVLLLDIVKGFSLYTTVPAVLSTSQPPSAITSINGIRVISMFWVIMCHTYFFLFEMQTFSNTYDVMTSFASRFSSQPILNGFFSVDSFFFLSGLLVAYLTFRQMDRSKGKFPYLPFYVHRVLRLTPTYMFLLFFYWFVTVHLGSGPLLNAAIGPGSAGANNCRDYWWTNLLYINNFVPTSFGKECMGWTWYLANDMQFYIISPIILIPLYFWLPSGLIAIGTILVASLGVTGFIAGYYEYTANSFGPMIDNHPLPKNQPDQSSEIYIKPYCRITPYVVGILLGYMLFKKYKIPIKKSLLGWCIHLGIWAVAIITGIANVYGLHSSWQGHSFSKAENVSYFMLSRFTWGVTLFLVVYLCHYGYGGVINRFLSMPLWIPLSRLTFNAYLVHEMIMLLMFSELRSTIYYNDADFVFYIIGMVVLSYGAAGVVSIFVEFPLSNLESAVFKLFGRPLHSSSRIVERGKRDATSPLEVTVETDK